MINSVRQTVMSVLNKNNYGYISPSDFNLFAKQAQLDLFEDYFYSYNYQINKENARKSGTGYADITKGLEEVIDTFSETLPLTQSVVNTNGYFLPSLLTTNNDYYLINKMLINNKVITSGTTTSNVVEYIVWLLTVRGTMLTIPLKYLIISYDGLSYQSKYGRAANRPSC